MLHTILKNLFDFSFPRVRTKKTWRDFQDKTARQQALSAAAEKRARKNTKRAYIINNS